MEQLLNFMAGSPFLTAFIVLIICSCIEGSFDSAFGTCKECRKRSIRERQERERIQKEKQGGEGK